MIGCDIARRGPVRGLQTELRIHARYRSERRSDLAKYLDFRHKERAPKLSRALQHRPDRPGADGAFQCRDQGAHARRAALGLGAALSERSGARLKNEQRVRRNVGDYSGIPRRLQKPTLHHPSERFLRVETDRRHY